jgi:hypothetical protein
MKSSIPIQIKIMSKLADVIAYLCVNYPYKHELSKARLTKLVYLSDWMSAQELGEQITKYKVVFPQLWTLC